MPLPNLYHTPPGTRISRVQRSTHQATQNRQHNPREKRQLPPQTNSRPQHINSPLQPSYLLVPSDWLQNQHVGQNNSNSVVYHLPTVGSFLPVLDAELQPPSAHITGGFGQLSPGFSDERSAYLYTGIQNNNGNIHSIDSSTPISSPSPDIRYGGADTGSNDVQVYEGLGPWNTLFDAQMAVENHEQDVPIYDPHSPNGGELPIIPQVPYNSSIGPNEFRSLPGYLGERNRHQLFDCFDSCRHRRYGRRGFSRRGNMIVHLRSCHNQDIPRGGL